MAAKRSAGLGGMTNLSVIAPIKSGMVVGFEPISYLERLRKVLDALQSARQNIRESELRAPYFPDAVGRFGIIHHFRYAIVPPVPEAAVQPHDGVWRLSLNVTFDGGWEPYMRVIYRDLGTLLDLLFCHSDSYPGSCRSRFETYCRWVRENEVEGGLFYTDSSATLTDQDYLARVEKVQRESRSPVAADLEIARLATPDASAQVKAALAAATKNPVDSLVLPLRTLKGLYRLSLYFPKGSDPQHDGGGDLGTLRRFARSVLEGPIEVIKCLDGQPEGPDKKKWMKLRANFTDELDWLVYADPDPAATVAPPNYSAGALQAHVFGSDEKMTHGCVLLLAVENANQAIGNLAAQVSLCGPVPAGGIGRLVAFTSAGLEKLGIAPDRLKALPQEFLDGMEARSALLGDVRGNHPDRWRRPLAYGAGPSGPRIDMGSVHVLIQLRLSDAAELASDLHPRLNAAIDVMATASTGLRVLAVQPTRSYRTNDVTTGHFDFADGLSQPKIVVPRPPAQPGTHSDAVSPGELLLGHGTDRGDQPHPQIERLLFDGSFLVIRKLRQRVDHIAAALAAVPEAERDDMLALMMGRRKDGTPLVAGVAAGSNDFSYATPAASDACPFHSHIRRANPRDGRDYTPRILRRGMSYGPKSETNLDDERGVVFMAYCASISEQFETLQRWMAGGNSSGVGSAQSDPFLAVPHKGDPRTFRCLDKTGKRVLRIDLGDKPWVELQWGLYLFVPSLAVLGALGSFRVAKVVPASAPAPIPVETGAQRQARIDEEERERVRQCLDDPERAPAAWKLVRDGSPRAPQNTPYGHLLGRLPDVMRALKDHAAKEYSVAGYGKRMEQSIGLNLLGLDPGPERDAQLALNKAVEAIKEAEAFHDATGVVEKVLKQFLPLPSVDVPPPPGELLRTPIDLVTFSDHVMAGLCRLWIGLPDDLPPSTDPVMQAGGRLEENTGVPRCPGNFATASRYIFAPHPRTGVEAAGQTQGLAVRKAVEDWLARKPQKLGSLARDIKLLLGDAVTDRQFALVLAGVLLGFPPTVQGNFIRTLETWIKDGTLWHHQQALFQQLDGPAATYHQAKLALRDELFATMRKRPVPEMLWRSPVRNGEPDLAPSSRVVLGITSALTDTKAPNELMFGRDGKDAAKATVHGCPGYEMATGVLLAMLAGLLQAGTLRPTGSPVLLILTQG
ncbi:MAG: hypothetical protein ABIO45_08785 [Burkholderiaceae bacterium]